VLIVEDRPELRALLQEMVRSLGYRATACGNRDDALKLMSAAPVDIVLIEDSLPGLAAHQLVSEVHAKDSHAKTVLLAVAANTAAHESDSILVKPFSLQTLAQKLEESEKLSQLH
jgi:two-component system response regulator (stage 0 sporulation protein F)